MTLDFSSHIFFFLLLKFFIIFIITVYLLLLLLFFFSLCVWSTYTIARLPLHQQVPFPPDCFSGKTFYLTLAGQTERARIVFVREKKHTFDEVFCVEYTQNSRARSTHHVGIQVLEERVAETVASFE